jgi:hypothetical protein
MVAIELALAGINAPKEMPKIAMMPTILNI